MELSLTPPAPAPPPPPSAVAAWSATLTVDRDQQYFGCDFDSLDPTHADCSALLTDDEITRGSTTYRVTAVFWNSNFNRLCLDLHDGTSDLSGSAIKRALGSLTLNVDGTALAVSAATAQTATMCWPYEPATDWTDGQQVRLSLTGGRGAPINLTVREGDARLHLDWNSPRVALVRYDVHYTSADAATVADAAASSGSDPSAAWVAAYRGHTGQDQTRTHHTIAGLDNGTTYRLRVRPVLYTTGRPNTNGGWVYGQGTPSQLTATLSVTPNPVPEVDYGKVQGSTDAERRASERRLRWASRAWVVVTLSRAAPADMVIPLTTAHGTTGDGDWSLYNPYVFIKRGETSNYAGGEPEDRHITGNVHADDTMTFIFARQDGENESPETMTVALDTANLPAGVFAGATTSATVTITDAQSDDPDAAGQGPGVEVSATELDVAVGADASYTVRLQAPPIDAVVVSPAVGDAARASVSPSQLVFTQGDWSTPQTVTVRGLSAGATAVSHTVQTTDPAYLEALLPTVAVTVAAPHAEQGGGPYAALVAKVKEWRNDPCCVDDQAHTDRWDRVLLALGETVADASLEPMTADEAQTYADRGWTRWVEVAAALRELENQAPTVSAAIADATIVNESGTEQVSLSGVFDDADSDALTITAAASDNAVATVSVAADYSTLAVNAHTRGTATITVTADDGNGGTVSDEFTVTVKAAPVVAQALADVSGLEVDATQDVSLSGVFADADGDSLTVTGASSDESVATVSVASDGSRLTLTGVAQGTATITVTAQDSDGNAVSDAFDVSVVAPPQQQQQQQGTPNQAPTVASAIADVTIVNESGTRQVSLSGVFDDADGDALTITAASSDNAKATVSAASDYSSLTVTAKSRGTATITVTAKDGKGGTVEDTFTVKVKAAPVVASAISDVSGLEAGATQNISLTGVFSDADGDSLTITASSSDETVVVAYEFDGVLEVFALAEGSATITVRAQDSDGNAVSDAFDVSVVKAPEPLQANRAPTVATAIDDITIVNESGAKQVSLSGVFSDADNDSMTVTAASSDEAVATVSVAVGYSALTVAAQSRGEATITVTASDGNGGTVEDTFDVTVKAAPGVASAISDVTGLEAAATQDISLSGTFNDADGDALTITAASSDGAKATVTVASDYSKLTVAGVAEGTATITVTAQDTDGNRVSDAFDVEVVEAEAEADHGDPPLVANLRCIAETDRVAFLWDAPEWSGGDLYAYDYQLTLPGGRSESGRIIGSTLLLRPGEYQQGAEASVNIKVVYETANGREVRSAAARLTCSVE